MPRFLTLVLCAFVALGALEPETVARADGERHATLFASGLDNPRGLAFDRHGDLYVAEAGRGGPTASTCAHTPPPFGPFNGGATARISKISPNGVRTTVVSGLPSGQTSPLSGAEVLGAEEVLFIGNTLFVLLQGGGCSKGNPSQANAILRVNPNGTTTQVANLTAFIESNPTAGPPDDDRDPQGVPTAFVASRGRFFVLEGNNAQLLRVTHSGNVQRVVDFSLIGQFTYTSLVEGDDGFLYVGTFGEVPYPDGSARIYRVSPDGQVSLYKTGLTTIIDMKLDCRGRLHVLESSTGNTSAPPFVTPASGRVRRLIDNAWQTVVDELTFPTGMAFGPGGDLFISAVGYGQGNNFGLGEIRRVHLGGPGSDSCH